MFLYTHHVNNNGLLWKYNHNNVSPYRFRGRPPLQLSAFSPPPPRNRNLTRNPLPPPPSRPVIPNTVRDLIRTSCLLSSVSWPIRQRGAGCAALGMRARPPFTAPAPGPGRWRTWRGSGCGVPAARTDTRQAAPQARRRDRRQTSGLRQSRQRRMRGGMAGDPFDLIRDTSPVSHRTASPTTRRPMSRPIATPPPKGERPRQAPSTHKRIEDEDEHDGPAVPCASQPCLTAI
jgi:hypothetical protein